MRAIEWNDYCHRFVISSLCPLPTCFPTIIVLPEFCSQQKRMMRKCENEMMKPAMMQRWFLSLRGSLANCFHSTRVAPSSPTVEVTRLSKSSAQNSAHATLFEYSQTVSYLNFHAKNNTFFVRKFFCHF